jgi:DNA-damage-inducible protein D
MNPHPLPVQFENYDIRRIWRNGEWWYSITDVVGALAGSTNSRRYWSDLKRKLESEGFTQLSENIVQLKVMSSDGKRYATDCANRATMLRIIQSIPSRKAEPFKQWLAEIGDRRLEEESNPEAALLHLERIYRALGRDEEWIEVRLRSVTVRRQLTDEWARRCVKKGEEFSRLTSIISRGVFGLTPAEHKRLKDLTV